MKPSRSFLMGVGTGLILSALLSIPFTLPMRSSSTAANGSGSKPAVADNAQGAGARTPADPDGKSLSQPGNSLDSNSPVQAQFQSSAGSFTAEPQSQPMPTLPATSVPQSALTKPAEQTFTIPAGSTSEQIADFLAAQGLISSRQDFLELVKEKGVESKFRAGTFKINVGSSPEQILEQLMKPPLKS